MEPRILLSLVVIILIGIHFSAPVMAGDLAPRDGLVAEWLFNEGNGSIAHDTSGNGNEGLIRGATWITGISGSALDFNGVDNSVTIPNSNSIDTIYVTNQFTISAWITQRTHPVNDWTRHQFILMKGSWDTEPGFFDLMYDAQFAEPLFGVGAKFDNRDPTYGRGAQADASAVPLNEWAHIAGSYDGSQYRIYVNGKLGVTSEFVGERLPVNTGPVTIGHFVNPSGLYPFNGAIDEVRLYNRALSESEIRVLAQSPSIPPVTVPGPHLAVTVLAQSPSIPQPTAITGLHLAVTKHADPYSMKQGQSCIVTVEITNDGTTDLHDIEVIDAVPSSLTLQNGNLSYTFKTLNSGESRIYQYMIQTAGAGTFDLGPVYVRFADPTGIDRTVKSQGTKIRVLPTLYVTPTTRSPGFDWVVVIGGLFILFLAWGKPSF